MAAGSQTSMETAGSGAGGTGIGIISSLFGGAGAGSSYGQTGPSTTPYFIENPSTGHDVGSSGWQQQLGQILSDPAVLKSFGELATQLGKTIKVGDGVPPHAAQFLQNSLNQKQGQDDLASTGTFQGDLDKFFSPEMATQVLNGLGIVGGFKQNDPMGGMQLAEADSPQQRRMQQMQEAAAQQRASAARQAGASARPGQSSGGGGFQGPGAAGSPPPAADVVRPSAPLTAGQMGGAQGGRQAGQWVMGPDGNPMFVPE